MAGREVPLVTGEYYHIFNRGVAKLPTFLSQHDYQQAMLGIMYYRFVRPSMKLSRYKKLNFRAKAEYLENLNATTEKLADIISFVLMPNHFHFLLRQTTDNGIAKYLSMFTNSYTRYFNTKLSRPGPVFQGTFKAVHVDNNSQLLHLSRYIHLNPYVSGIVNLAKLPTYSWSSLPAYFSGKSDLVEINQVLFQFKGTLDYQKFIFDHADYARELELIKHQAIDIDIE